MYTSNNLLAIKPTMHDVIQKISPRETPARKINHALAQLIPKESAAYLVFPKSGKTSVFDEYESDATHFSRPACKRARRKKKNASLFFSF